MADEQPVSPKAAKARKKRMSRVNLTWLLPNLLTLSALMCGMYAIRLALVGRFEAAVFLVTIATIFDALDGRMARLFKSSSEFGAQLDSLSDMVAFGVVPALLLYLFALHDGGHIAWMACLFYTSCCALRLARFNSEIYDKPSWSANYFTGIPAPAAGLLVLWPLVGSFEFDWPFLSDTGFLIFWMVAIGMGAISTVPTFAGKGVSIPRPFALPALGLFAIVISGLIARPWETLMLLGVIYLAMIPVSFLRFQRLKSRKESS